MTQTPADRCQAAGLDARESRLLLLVARGRRNDYIAKDLSCTERRVQAELDALARKLKVNGRVGLGQFFHGTLPSAPVRTVLCFQGEEIELR